MPPQTILTLIRESWGWAGLDPVAVVAMNDFGNVLVLATDGSYWRLCPEELYCEVVAPTKPEFDSLWSTNDFQDDWQMTSLVETAKATLGPVSDDRCYCLKIPAVLGGQYDAANLGTITKTELIQFTGSVAKQIHDVPDGASVTFDWTK